MSKYNYFVNHHFDFYSYFYLLYSIIRFLEVYCNNLLSLIEQSIHIYKMKIIVMLIIINHYYCNTLF